MEKQIADEIRKILEDHEKRIIKLENNYNEQPITINKKISVKEFILSTKPKDEVDKTLVVAYYLEKYELIDSFNTVDLEKAFRSTKEPIPKNLNYKVIRNVAKGLMMECKEKKDGLKAWMLTASGENLVKDNLTRM